MNAGIQIRIIAHRYIFPRSSRSSSKTRCWVLNAFTTWRTWINSNFKSLERSMSISKWSLEGEAKTFCNRTILEMVVASKEWLQNDKLQQLNLNFRLFWQPVHWSSKLFVSFECWSFSSLLIHELCTEDFERISKITKFLLSGQCTDVSANLGGLRAERVFKIFLEKFEPVIINTELIIFLTGSLKGSYS